MAETNWWVKKKVKAKTERCDNLKMSHRDRIGQSISRQYREEKKKIKNRVQTDKANDS